MRLPDEAVTQIVVGAFALLSLVAGWLTKRADSNAKGDERGRTTTAEAHRGEAASVLSAAPALAELATEIGRLANALALSDARIAVLEQARDDDANVIRELVDRDDVAMTFIRELLGRIERVDPPAPQMPARLLGRVRYPANNPELNGDDERVHTR